MKQDLRIIGYITSAIFILLWINQLFSGIKLYENEKTQWKIHVDSIIDNNIKALSLSDIHPDPVPTFIQLDSLLHGSTHYPVHFVIQQIDSSGLELFHYSRNRENTAKMIHAKAYPIADTPGEVLLVHYNFPFAYLLEKSWQDMLAIVALTLLLVFGLLYLSHAQQHLSRLQEQMIKQVVHDWKTPLSSISTLAELVERKSIAPEDEQGLKKIHLIQEEANRLKIGSQQLLKTLSGLAHLQINRSEFNLKDELLALLEKQRLANHGQKDLQLQLRYLVESETAYVSHFYLLGAIQNLLDNAVKYSGKAPHVTVICYQKRGTLVIEVRDNGVGIPKKQQKYIFNKYYQVNKGEPAHGKKGYGLGLNYVYNVVKAHKGKITVNSTPGKGSTFTIYISKWRKK
ncbi:HAMP domain-containing sensor histidine kinase [Butyricimonas sp.]|uniref:sensor histidine kinase n=1 Tax=Butyricimonas sp. TaxID=1969738 RepID=UPI0025C57C0F|nr:HAMP domain-containing sensor histidine kinase [Butyricimonas sp.]